MRILLEAQPRLPMTKGAIKRLRAQGLIPITVSARGEGTKMFSVSERHVTEIVGRYGPAALIQLKGAGGGTLAIPRDIQRDAISHRLLHVGFRRVSAREPVTAKVRVVLVGEPPAARANHAVLEQEADTVEVRAMPDRLPTHIDIDVSGMEIGDIRRVSDIPTTSDYEIVEPPETVMAVLHAVRVAVTPEEAEAPAEKEAEQAEQKEEAA